MMELKDCLRGDATFVGYRKGVLIYKCANGFIFEVPTDETDDATFHATERAMLLMKWIKAGVADIAKQGGELNG